MRSQIKEVDKFEETNLRTTGEDMEELDTKDTSEFAGASDEVEMFEKSQVSLRTQCHIQKGLPSAERKKKEGIIVKSTS